MPRRCALILMLAILGGCGYGFQSSRSSDLARKGVHSVYVAPVTNKSYKPGVEHMVYSAMIQQIATHRRVRLVRRPEDADAILTVSVAGASMTQSGATTAANLNPINTGSSSVIVSTSYSANLDCRFVLTRRPPPPKAPYEIWSSSASKTKDFPGNNQLGVLGSTSALINDSEFDRALGDLAHDIASDVHESMLDMF